jgi:hypothetical protein
MTSFPLSTRRVVNRLCKGLLIASLVIVAGIVGLLALLLVLWLTSFVAPAEDDCAFNSVSKAEYRRLLGEAKAQEWTVWPGLSNGIFWPSDRGLKQPTQSFESMLGSRLLRSIEQLTTNPASADAQLAAAHAVMRSIRAEYVSVFDIPDFRENGKLVRSHVHFMYFMPQIRFAPLCFFCLPWWSTTVQVVFRHDVAAASYGLERVVVLHSGLKYDPTRERNTSDECPVFPGTTARSTARAELK